MLAMSLSQVLLHVGVERLPPVRRHVRGHLLSLHEKLDGRQVLDPLSLRDLRHLVHVDANHLDRRQDTGAKTKEQAERFGRDEQSEGW